MERLTHKSRSEAGYKANKEVPIWECIDKLGNLEDLKDQGRLLELPCKVGERVWHIFEHSGGGRVPNWGEINECEFTLSMYEEIGKTVFFTLEEAKLKCEYRYNQEFHDYVDRYAHQRKISVDEALKHELVLQAYLYYNDVSKSKK